MSITYSECEFVALGFQHAMRMRVLFLWPALLYTIFPHYLKNDTVIEKTSSNTICILIFSIPLSETFLVLRRIERDMIINVF
jgi:hypothetical protein